MSGRRRGCASVVRAACRRLQHADRLDITSSTCLVIRSNKSTMMHLQAWTPEPARLLPLQAGHHTQSVPLIAAG